VATQAGSSTFASTRPSSPFFDTTFKLDDFEMVD
jgi:hypothetical protein